jgi:hypothetical protein
VSSNQNDFTEINLVVYLCVNNHSSVYSIISSYALKQIIINNKISYTTLGLQLIYENSWRGEMADVARNKKILGKLLSF